MIIRDSLLCAVLALFAWSSSVSAQGFAPKAPAPDKMEVPRGFAPPPGMCRIWVDNVPAGKQPPPTDCASAIRNRPSNGRVVFGDDTRTKAPPKDEKGAAKSKPGPKKP